MATTLDKQNCHMAIDASTRSLASVPVTAIVPDPSQPRRDFDPESLDRLAASIHKHGLMHPIRVRWEAALGQYMIVSGERRYRAVQQLGWQRIDCLLVEGELTEAERLEEQLTENLLRQDLNPIEKALGMRAFLQVRQCMQKQLAGELQMEASEVTRCLALLELPDKLQHLVADGTLAPRTAYEITKLREAADQLEVAGRVVEQKLDTKSTEELVRRHKGKASTGTGRPAPRGKRSSAKQIGLNPEEEGEAAADAFPVLLHHHQHPGGHVISVSVRRIAFLTAVV
jgi:ParB family chromosome partitioning protein